jgi:FkbM family methyltransferase
MDNEQPLWKGKIAPFVRAVIPRGVRNFLRRPRMTAKRLKAKAAFYMGRVARVKMRGGWELRCHPICQESFQVFANDPLQRVELDQFAHYASQPMRLLDVGSHWGVFTLAALKYGGEGSQVLCVEASPSATKILNVNVRLNAGTEFVTVVQAAAGATDAALQMLTTGAGGDDYLVVPFSSRRDTVTIRQVNLDNLCAGHHFKPSHVKIDVEGFEEEALKGAISILQEAKPILFLELHGNLIRRRGSDPIRVLDPLKECGYCRWEQFGRTVTKADLAQCGYNARLACFPET